MEVELRKMTNQLSGITNLDNEIQFQLKIYNNLKQILENVVTDPIKNIDEEPKKGDIIKFIPKDTEDTTSNLETTDNSCVYDDDNLLGLILDKQDNNYLIKTFKGEYTNCNKNLFVKISPIKNEIQYIKKQLQNKTKKITV